jgi:hypothetical protein
MTFIGFICKMFIVLFILCLYALLYDIKRLINTIEYYYRPKIDKDINYTLFGICLLSFFLGVVLTFFIYSFV